MMNWKDNVVKNLLTYALVFSTTVAIHSAVFTHVYFFENGVNTSMVTAFYWTIMTMTTVGYGDVVLTSPLGQLYSVFVAITGIILIFGLMFPVVVTPWIEKRLRGLQLPTKPPENLKEHIIICGYNQIVEVLLQELSEHNQPFVVLDDDAEKIAMLQKKSLPSALATPSDEKTLIDAGIKRAKILIANKNDEENASIILSAREICDVEIIAVVEDLKKADYLRYAGATRVISPKTLLGRYIGRKSIYRLTDQIMDATQVFEGLDVSEFFIYPKSTLINKSIRENDIRRRTGANIIGMWKGGRFHLNPSPDEIIRENSVLLACGTKEQLTRLKRLTW
jgi:voltage-gated potassium channel